MSRSVRFILQLLEAPYEDGERARRLLRPMDSDFLEKKSMHPIIAAFLSSNPAKGAATKSFL